MVHLGKHKLTLLAWRLNAVQAISFAYELQSSDPVLELFGLFRGIHTSLLLEQVLQKQLFELLWHGNLTQELLWPGIPVRRRVKVGKHGVVPLLPYLFLQELSHELTPVRVLRLLGPSRHLTLSLHFGGRCESICIDGTVG